MTRITQNFIAMLDIAKKEIANAEREEAFQVIVIEYANGAFETFLLSYSDCFTGDKVVCAVEANTTPEIKNIVCMWSHGGVDLPSYSLRTSLGKLSAKNFDAKILLQGEDSLIVKEMGKTLK